MKITEPLFKWDTTITNPHMAIPHSVFQNKSKSKVKDCTNLSVLVYFAASVKSWILHQCLSVGLLLQALLSGVVFLKDRREERMERVMPAFENKELKPRGCAKHRERERKKSSVVKVFASLLP